MAMNVAKAEEAIRRQWQSLWKINLPFISRFESEQLKDLFIFFSIKKVNLFMFSWCFSWWRWPLLTYEEFLPKPDEEDSILNNIWRSDELWFQFNSKIKRHHCVYWTEENQRVTVEKEVNLPGIIVWATTFSLGIIGPFFFFEGAAL